jgi:bifunctional UDP-N-acetylglucosamine pyrophosphorylase/glucosamine-1-phosphate N-acetyltransferase
MGVLEMLKQRKDICALVLSAGKGTRMKSALPKVLHLLLGEPMLWYVHYALRGVFDRQDIFYVIGYKADLIKDSLDFIQGQTVYQQAQLGTGHALQCAYSYLVERGYEWCLVVNGDVPLLNMEKVLPMMEQALLSKVAMAFLTIYLDDPKGYGRVIRDDSGNLKGIVEEKDIGDKVVRETKEVNAGIYFINLKMIKDYLFKLTNENRQGEYYLPQLIEFLVRDGRKVLGVSAGEDTAFLGVNSSRELVKCDELLRNKITSELLDKGVLIYNPDQVRIGPKVEIEVGARITGPVEIYGECSIERDVVIDSYVWITNSKISFGSRIFSFSHIEEATIGPNSKIGPFARLRPGAVLVEDVKVGNFVEIKKSLLEKGVKASHLSYLGDSFIGEDTNIGAGTITCNYDGKNKHKTYIGRSVFVGSNTSLVAPLKIGDRALIGAGSTITKDVPNGALALERSEQKNLKRG